MINTEPSHKELVRLWELCSGFIQKRDLTCPEDIWQNSSDTSIEKAYELINEIADLTGFAERE